MAYFDTKSGSLEEAIRGAVKEKLVGGQKKLDKDKDGYIDAKDFAALRKSKDKKEGAKPDFLDLDKDGDKKEPMQQAAADVAANEPKPASEPKLTDKQKRLPPALQQAIAKKNKDSMVTAGLDDNKDSVVKEGEEDKAELVMAAKDMVDRITSWMEDTAEMQSESMLELGDAIRDEMGSQQSEGYIQSVKPALEELYTSLESTRAALTQGVGMLTGEEMPGEPMGADEMMPDDPMADPEMEPTVDDDFEASEPAAGGEEPTGRTRRESIELSRKLGQILSSKKK